MCQEVCPFNRFEEETIEHAFRPDHIDYAAPTLESILSSSEEEFKKTYAESPIKRVKWERLARNAAVAAGNSGRRELIPPLKRLLENDNELVKEHALWALDQLTET